MSYLFFKGSSIEILPNISNWDVNNVTNMEYMLCCSNLISLPDISK